MIAKFRHSLGLSGEWSFKKILGAAIFLAIIIVFVGFNVRNDTGSDPIGGAAATVNDVAIPYTAFRGEADQRERMIQERLGDLPEAQRKMYTQSIRGQVLENLITGEIIFQTAAKHGVVAADGAIRDLIASAPGLQENGVFQRERYRAYLQQANMSAADFERQMRKQIVTQKMYELFLGSNTPSQEELRRNRTLATHKINIRFVELSKDDLAKLARVTDAEVAGFSTGHAAEIETFYKDNKVDFTKSSRYHARDILIRIDEKRTEAAARKIIEGLAAKATRKNFVELVAKHSEDPGTKAKGGDLGERDQGSLPASFETPVLALEPGQISRPLKIEGGYHLVLLETKTEGGTTPFDEARSAIARKLLARAREDKVLTEVKTLVASGDRKAVDNLVAKLNKKWQPSTEFDLSSTQIPKLGEGRDVINGVLENGRAGGLVKRLVNANNQNLIVDVVSWKETPDKTADVAGLDKMVAAKRAEGAFETWIKGVEKTASIQRNQRLLE
jgi:peptidyl-prolyl cis-trans isomerase D